MFWEASLETTFKYKNSSYKPNEWSQIPVIDHEHLINDITMSRKGQNSFKKKQV